MRNSTDFLVVGARIIGISVARELKRRHPDAAVQVLEKEAACGRHASGRNSGVLHAGFYYTADSLKARFARAATRPCGLIARPAACRSTAAASSSLPATPPTTRRWTELLRRGNEIETSQGRWAAGYVVNSAGLHADRIARQFGFSRHYTILRFKGLYLYGDEPAVALRTNIYPVPDLRNPFLGGHFTVTVDGHVKIGPTAIPAFWREQYRGLGGLDLRDLAEIARLQL